MNSTKMKCWNCKNDINDLASGFCHSCNIIQTPYPITHFSRLGIPEDFDLGLKKLDLAYFSLQSKLHPDRFTNKTETEKKFSIEQSIALNQAYETLKNPLNRAEYMLQLRGIIVNSDKANTHPSQEILETIMQQREQAAMAKSTEEVRSLIINAVEEKLSCINTLKNDFNQGKLDNAAQNVIKLKYLEKLLEDLKRIK